MTPIKKIISKVKQNQQISNLWDSTFQLFSASNRFVENIHLLRRLGGLYPACSMMIPLFLGHNMQISAPWCWSRHRWLIHVYPRKTRMTPVIAFCNDINIQFFCFWLLPKRECLSLNALSIDFTRRTALVLAPPPKI